MPLDGAARVESREGWRVFLGTYTPRLDDKGRMILPAKYRERLAGGLVIAKGQENCLYVFPTDEFMRMAQAMQSAPMTSRKVRDYTRVLLSGAYDEVPDKQGRVTIPAALRGYAGLERECTLIGTGARLELWDTAAWESYLAESEESYTSQAEEVIPGLL